jgi:hypothetical protein
MAAGFEEHRPSLREQPLHQQIDRFLQERLATGDLHERTVEPCHLRQYIVQ